MTAKLSHAKKNPRKRKLTPLSFVLIATIGICLIASIIGITISIINKAEEEKQHKIAMIEQQKADIILFRQQHEQEAQLKKAQLAQTKRQALEFLERQAEEKRKIAEEKRRIAKEKARKEAAIVRARVEAARKIAAQKEAQRAAEEKARLAAERAERIRLSYLMKEQALRLDAEQLEYNSLMPTSIVSLPVENILQSPELPNGCEITSLAIVLNYLGYPVDKSYLSDAYLPMSEFRDVNKKRVGGDPNLVYCGNPRYNNGGYYCFAPPIVQAANSYLSSLASDQQAVDITGSGETEIITQLDSGRPIIAFTTLSMGDPVIYEPSKWLIEGTSSSHIPYINLHCVVLYGYDEQFIYIADPMKGLIQCKRTSFFDSYTKMGSRAVIVY